MKDKKYIERFAKKFGLRLLSYTDPKFICEDAIKNGAIESLCMLSNQKYTLVNFELDKDGNCIGTSRDGRESFEKRKIK